jgi:hypothetical protein
MSSYEYPPLNPESHETRLLQVQKSTDKSAPITLALRRASLDDGQPFNALSYTWGDETPTTQIAIHDGVTLGLVSVRRNLFEFLKEARQSTEPWSLEWIWIDQISINQNDHSERCHQVGQMRRLYSIAQATLVWPFSWSESSLEATQNILARYPVDLNALICASPTQKMTTTHFAVKKGILQSDEPLLSHFTYNLYIQLLTTPYWKRLWIIQEIVLASQHQIVISGLLWDLRAVKRVINHIHEWLQVTIVDDEDVEDVKRRLDSFNNYRHDKMIERATETIDQKSRQRWLSWDSALGLGVGSNCTMPLDRVYGVMGLLHEDLHIPPDYDISETELLRLILDKQTSANLSYIDSRWEKAYRVLQAWHSTGLQRCGGVYWDKDLGGQNSPLSRKTKKQIVRLALVELNTPIPSYTYKDAKRYISPWWVPLRRMIKDELQITKRYQIVRGGLVEEVRNIRRLVNDR